jgi:pantoate--beta-alanine ligase
MKIVHDLPGLRAQIRVWHAAGKRIAFVPTLGNLHDGHLSLIAKARDLADHTVASIFVNPIQFGRGEDYERYPSTLEADCTRLRALGLDLLFTPDLKQLYPGGIEVDTRVTVPRLSNILCGEMRPGHFSGVATVVSKLFFNVQPDVALFGEKDYQQLLVIRRMVHDLCIPVTVVGMPTVREADGLAMSSRNGYLTPEERSRAPLIYQTLRQAAATLRAGKVAAETIERDAWQALAAAGFRPEYVSIRRLDDLEPPAADERRFSILAAAWLGGARLIDNIKVDLDAPADGTLH